jgi:uncharacterized RDD family membrane protein YckC
VEPTIKYHPIPDCFYAGFWIRVAAYLVDLVMIGSIVRFVNGPVSMITGGVNELSVWHLRIGAAMVIYPLYFILLTKFTDGQTLGKMIFGLRVVSLTEESLSWKTVLIRELFGRYIQKTILFLYLVAAFTPKKQHVADLLTDTAVVSENTMSAIQYGMNHVHAPQVPPPIHAPQVPPPMTQPPSPAIDTSEDADPKPPVMFIRDDKY